ncbi:MAG: glycosyltransferase family 9 protein, partial [Pseudomonadota bacterium]
LRPHIRLGLDYEKSGWHGLYLEKPDTLPPIPRVDIAVAFLTDPEGRVAGNLRACLPEAAVRFFPPFPPREKRTHVALTISLSLEEAGLPIDSRKVLPAAERRALLRRNVSSLKKGLVFHPGSGSPLKNHPPDFWLTLIKRIKKKFSVQKSAVLLGPAEEPLLSFYRENLSGSDPSLIFSPGREQLMELLEEAALFIGHDSGVTHLSAMLGAPTLALFKSSSPDQWRPLGPSVSVIEGTCIDEGLLARIDHAAEKLMRKAFMDSADTPG